MAFTWHGRDSGGVVWEQEITRYYFISDEEVAGQGRYGPDVHLRLGGHVKLSKSEVRKFFKDGYILLKVSNWNEKTDRYEPAQVAVSKGRIGRDIETRVLREYMCSPEDVALPKRKKK